MLVFASKFYVVLLTFGAISYVTTVMALEEQVDCKPDCDSKIFCSGDILHDVQMSNIFPDSKSFVDAKLKFSEAEIIKNYTVLKKQSSGQLSYEQIKQFVDGNFYNPEDLPGLEEWLPPDFNSTPSIVENIGDENYKKFARDLNELWKTLSVKVSQDVKEHPDRYSLFYLPNGFIKAGDRFGEMHYWDIYWVIRGLLLCGMHDTARGIIENMIYLLKNFTFVPNGSRKYYIQRSQPPLLIQMYFDLEFRFWFSNRRIKVQKDGREYKMFRYNAAGCTPRPEAYREDYNNSKQLPEGEKKRFFTGIRSAAESGWDFSSRHIRATDNSNNASLPFIDTQSFVPVDLNCILHANAIVLSEWHSIFGKQSSANKYRSLANDLQEAIDKVLWNEEAGIWLDWDLKTQKSRNYFYPSNLTPLWTGSYKKYKSYYFAEKAIAYLIKNGIIDSNLSPRFWGVPTSTKNDSGQQWDFPNAWAPLQAIVIQGLERTGHPVAGHIAFNMAKKWINTTYTSYQKDKFSIHEKYNVVKFAERGLGGEYKAPENFAKMNGYILEILCTYGKYFDSGST